MEKIGDSDSFVATVQELKNTYVIDEEDDLNNCISCALCSNTSFKHDLWFILKEAGSGSMDDYICSDCIKKIKYQLDKTNKPKIPKFCNVCGHIFKKGERKKTLFTATLGKNIYFCKKCYGER